MATGEANHHDDNRDEDIKGKWTTDCDLREASPTIIDSAFSSNSSMISNNYQKIAYRRKCMKWLPMHSCSNDLVYGSWWFFWGSVLTIFIPLCPIISLLAGLWVDTEPLSYEAYIAAYGLLVCSGLFYSLGSFAFLRAVEDIQLSPLFQWKHFETDELFAMWMFFVGTVFNIPCVGLYMYYDQSNVYYPIAFAIVIVSTMFLSFLTYSVYMPEDTNILTLPAYILIFQTSLDSAGNLMRARHTLHGRHKQLLLYQENTLPTHSATMTPSAPEQRLFSEQMGPSYHVVTKRHGRNPGQHSLPVE